MPTGQRTSLFDGKAVTPRPPTSAGIPQTGTAYVPTFFKNTVVAFKVE
jgi:hypothetical protein